MTEIPPGWCPRVSERIVEQVVEDELVLYDPGSDQVHILNTFAAAIYDLCDGRTSIAAIAAELGKSLPATAFDLTEETRRLVASLMDKKILE